MITEYKDRSCMQNGVMTSGGINGVQTSSERLTRGDRQLGRRGNFARAGSSTVIPEPRILSATGTMTRKAVVRPLYTRAVLQAASLVTIALSFPGLVLASKSSTGQTLVSVEQIPRLRSALGAPRECKRRSDGWTRRPWRTRSSGFITVGSIGELDYSRTRGGRRTSDASSGRFSGGKRDNVALLPPWMPGRRGRDCSSVVLDAGTGETEYYSWTETESDVEVRITLPPETSAKKVQLSVTKSSLTLGLEGREGPVLQGQLKGKVKADLSHWTMEENQSTGEKVLHVCLEKAIDMDALAQGSMPTDWVGVLEDEEALNVYYPEKDKDFDVQEYVKKMGYDRDRDIDKVDKTMFSGLTEEMRKNLAASLPKSSYTPKDDIIPVVSEPRVSSVIDTEVLGVSAAGDVSEGVGDVLAASATAEEVVRNGESPVPAGNPVPSEAMKDATTLPETRAAQFVPGATEGGEPGPSKELTARQRKVSAGLRDTYEKLLKAGMLKANPDGTPVQMPDMDEMARQYEQGAFMFRDGDFSDEELSKYEASVVEGLQDSGDIDVDDPSVRAAFDLDPGV